MIVHRYCQKFCKTSQCHPSFLQIPPPFFVGHRNEAAIKPKVELAYNKIGNRPCSNLPVKIVRSYFNIQSTNFNSVGRLENSNKNTMLCGRDNLRGYLRPAYQFTAKGPASHLSILLTHRTYSLVRRNYLCYSAPGFSFSRFAKTANMEYDNDRPVKSAYKIEIFYWVLLGIINPLVNSLTLFWDDPRIWAVLFLVSLLILPAYILYSEIVPGFLFQKRYIAFILISIVYFATIQVLLFAVYSVILKFPLSPPEGPISLTAMLPSSGNVCGPSSICRWRWAFIL